MRKTFLLILFLLVLSLPLFAMGEKSVSLDSSFEKVKAADFTLPDLEDKIVRLSDYKGKVVFLNFWASWCPPCKGEMPSIQALHDNFKDKDFVVLAVAMDRSGKNAVQPYIQENGYTFKVLLDPASKVGNVYHVVAYPTTFIINKKGVVVAQVVGGRDWADKKTLGLFQNLIEEHQ